MKAALGIDLGGTTIDAVLVGRSKKILWHEQLKTEDSQGYAGFLTTMEGLVRRARERAEIVGLGIGVPGPVAPGSLTLSQAVNLGWDTGTFAEDLRGISGTSLIMLNDGAAAAFGEHTAGALRGVSSGILLTLGTGVGGGVLLRGSLYEGERGLAMEVGHMTVAEDGFYRCGCGRRGCFETLASAGAIVADAHNRLTATGPDHWLDARIPFDARIIMDGAQTGDPLCEAVVHDWIQRLATGVHNLRMLYDPEIIAFGGGLSNAWSYWGPRLSEAVLRQTNFQSLSLPRLEKAVLGSQAGAFGAAWKAFQVLGKARDTLRV